MNKKSLLVDYKFASTLAQDPQEATRFQRISSYQVSRKNNQQADSPANEAINLKVGELRANGSLISQTIP